jgi:DDE superfamily endonuclease
MIRRTDDPTVEVLDVDQAELALNPTRSRVWAPIGVPVELETPGDNRKQVLFGAVNDRSGQTHMLPRPHKRSADFQAFVDAEIIPAYPNAEFLFLIVDGASIYESKSTRNWLRERPQLVLVPLPKYAPKLNAQEQIWRWMRAEVTHNHFFGSLAAELAAAHAFFTRLAERPQEVLRRIGRAFPSLLEHHLAPIS